MRFYHISTVAYFGGGGQEAMAPPHRDTLLKLKNGISTLYILLESALKRQEMPFQSPKFQNISGEGHFHWNCIITFASPSLKSSLRYCISTTVADRITTIRTRVHINLSQMFQDLFGDSRLLTSDNNINRLYGNQADVLG